VPQGLPERSFHEGRIEQQVGDPAALEQVTFLVPNGWQGHDGGGICDSENLAQTWHGRTEAAGDGWIVTFDRDAAMDPAAWKDLKESGGHRFTHAGRLSRADGSAFTGDEAFEALARVRLGLNLALGRRVTCALPVGWRDGQPVWCRWRSAPVDGYRDVNHWLDDTTSYRQVGDVVSRVLAFTASPVNRESLKYATSYYVAANVDVDVELSVGVPVSGLQLLAYLRFVTERGTYSRTRWEALKTEGELRLLIEEIGIDTSVPAHFSHLTDVRDRLARTGPPRDALGVVIKMRNIVTHPTLVLHHGGLCHDRVVRHAGRPWRVRHEVVHRDRRAQVPGALASAGVLYGLRDVPRAAARQEIRVTDCHEDRPDAVLGDGLRERTWQGWHGVMGSGHDPVEPCDVGCGGLGLPAGHEAGCLSRIVLAQRAHQPRWAAELWQRTEVY
jgi:hypothetical protein